MPFMLLLAAAPRSCWVSGSSCIPKLKSVRPAETLAGGDGGQQGNAGGGAQCRAELCDLSCAFLRLSSRNDFPFTKNTHVSARRGYCREKAGGSGHRTHTVSEPVRHHLLLNACVCSALPPPSTPRPDSAPCPWLGEARRAQGHPICREAAGRWVGSGTGSLLGPGLCLG